MWCRKNVSDEEDVTETAPVYLNVYDITPMNGYTYWVGLGVYHSGVQVHGIEYAFGAHEYPTTGIFEGEPKQCDGFTFRKTILVGRTKLSPREVRAVMEELANEYKGIAYNLITKNCNHFCNAACIKLTGNPIPSWINRLARIGFLCNCVLPVSLNSTRVRHHQIENKVCEEEKKKLRSRSSRFTSSSNSPSSSSSSPPPTTRVGRSRHRNLPPSSPLIFPSSSS